MKFVTILPILGAIAGLATLGAGAGTSAPVGDVLARYSAGATLRDLADYGGRVQLRCLARPSTCAANADDARYGVVPVSVDARVIDDIVYTRTRIAGRVLLDLAPDMHGAIIVADIDPAGSYYAAYDPACSRLTFVTTPPTTTCTK